MTSTHTINTVERACTDLAHDGRPVTFTAIATATGLSRSTLYRNPALRAIVEQHQARRRRTPHAPHRRDRDTASRSRTPSPTASAATTNNSAA